MKASKVLKMLNSQAAIFGSRYVNKLHLIFRHSDLSCPSSVPMLEVLWAVTGESIAVFEDEEIADPPASIRQPPSVPAPDAAGNASVKALKQRLARKIGLPRFRLRLLQDNCPLDDNQNLISNQTLTRQVVQLVILPPDMEQDREIMVACRQNDDKLLERHLNQPRNPNFEDATAMTPLRVASLNGSLKCVYLLIEAGANKDQGTTDTGATPLFIAAQNGHLEVVRFLVESGANKDQGTTNYGATPLFIAAENRHLEVVQFLVGSGANMEQGTTDDGGTPLFIAAQNGHLEVVRFLVESGANKDQGTTDDGTTPLFQAAHEGHLEVVRFLVESRADKDQGTTDDGSTPLYAAAAQGHLEVVRFLVESRADKDQGTTDDGSTPLYAAAAQGHLEVVRFLFKSGANKDVARHHR